MKAIAFTIFICFVAFAPKVQAEHTFTTIGIITQITHTNAFGIDIVTLNIHGKTTQFHWYIDSVYHDSLYINKQVKITYTVNQTLKEVDMYANGASVYVDRKKARDISQAQKVEGVLEIYDYGCALPGRYHITSSDSLVTTISHYVVEKYQKPHELNVVTVYYTPQIRNYILTLSLVSDQETEEHHPFSYICFVPKEHPDTSAVVWLGFNNYQKGAFLKFSHQNQPIALVYEKEEYMCDSCMYPSTSIYFLEIENEKIIGKYKFIHSGNVLDLKYTPLGSAESVIYYHDQKSKPFSSTPCF